MKKPLLNVIFASEKRKDVLLLLQNGPWEMEYILDQLETTRPALLPQIRILEDNHLVTHEKDTYELTTIGELVVKEIIPLVGIIDVLDGDIDYWGNHNLSFVPPYLLERIGELGECTLIEVPFSEMFDEDKSFIEEVKRTKFLCTIVTFLYPSYKQTLSELLSVCADISIIVSEELYQKMLRENLEDFLYFIQKTPLKLYRYSGNFEFLSFSLTNHVIMLRLLTKEGDYDNKRFLCSSEGARQWGKDLFEYFLKDSTPITEL